MRRMIALIVILLFVGCALAASGQDGSAPNEEALTAAEAAEVPGGLTEREAEIFRLGYAAGYYAALHPQDNLNEYILNTNTMKFHYPSCQSAASIAPHNREIFHGTREEAIAAGYKPCGVCKP